MLHPYKNYRAFSFDDNSKLLNIILLRQIIGRYRLTAEISMHLKYY